MYINPLYPVEGVLYSFNCQLSRLDRLFKVAPVKTLSAAITIVLVFTLHSDTATGTDWVACDTV